LLDGKCLTNCPLKYYPENSKCLACNPECLTCRQGPASCVTCNPGFLFINSTSTCLSNCTALNQYYNSAIFECQNCSIDCQTCYGSRYDQCLSCNTPLALYNSVCVLQCPDGLFRNSNTVCQLCDPWSCLTCQGSSTNCTSCIYPKLLIVNNQIG
jgi:proprotein convertase subtilisin/kexin type 5